MERSIFSAQLQKLRKEKRVTQEQLANYLGVSPQAVSKWENGTYPEGDLLPRIADYFEVSIDYLYGRGSRGETIEQKIVNSFMELHKKGKHSDHELCEKIMGIIWATMVGCWQENYEYYDRNKYTQNPMASTMQSDEGFNFMRMGPDWEFYFMFPEPEKGYASILSDLSRVAELFRFLGNETVLKAFLYLDSLASRELVTKQELCRVLQTDEATVEEIILYLQKLPPFGILNAFTIKEDGQEQRGYDFDFLRTLPFWIMFAGAAEVLEPPRGYCLQNNFREKSLVRKDMLSWLKN